MIKWLLITVVVLVLGSTLINMKKTTPPDVCAFTVSIGKRNYLKQSFPAMTENGFNHVFVYDGNDNIIKTQFSTNKLQERTNNYFKIAQGDDYKRTSWRTKQVSDFAHAGFDILTKCPDTEWFLFFEDDMVCTKHKNYIMSKINDNDGMVILAPTSSTGAFIAHRLYLLDLVAYWSLRTDFYPVDWLTDTHHTSLTSNPIKKYNIFKHIGKVSTFDGKNI